MTSERTDEAMRRRDGWRAWLRHGGALGATVALNALLLAFLVAWRADRGEAQPPVRAVPLQVVEPEVIEEQPEEPEPVVEMAAPEPVQEPPLPEPPLPEPAPPELPEEPPPVRLDIEVPLATETPAFEALPPPPVEPTPPPPPQPRPAPPKPAPRPTPKPPPEPEPAPRRGPDRSPVVLEPPDLSAYYPRRARMRGVSGRSTIRVTVDRRGTVTGVQVLASTPADVFDHAARRVGRSLRFRPALRDGEPVAATVTLKLVWRLE